MHIDRMIYGMLAGAAAFLICYILFIKKKRLPKSRLVYTALLFVYVGALIFLTMLFAPPWSWNISQESTRMVISKINLTPIKFSMEIYKNCEMIGNFKDFYILIGGNLAMLMPLSIIASLINPKFKLMRISLLAVGVAFSIEIMQLINNILLGAPLRTVEIDDFILNVSGSILAYIIFAIGRGIYRFCFKRRAKR